MIDPLPPRELIDRIRLAAAEASRGQRRVTPESLAQGELPPVPAPLAPPSLPGRTGGKAGGSAGITPPLEQAAEMLPRARQKLSVGKNVPGLLRPLFRNQGGYNHILLETIDRLIEANHQLQRQNQEFHERFLALQGWMNEAALNSSLDHDWMLAVENRLRGVTSDRLAALEERLKAAQKTPAPENPSGPRRPGTDETS